MVTYRDSARSLLAEDLADGVKRRIKILVLASTIAVALAFGCSFYFALLSNQTAIVQKMPELEAVVGKLKSMLVFNTFGFAAVIIASFMLLSAIISGKLFRPVSDVYHDLASIEKGTLPATESGDPSEGPFSALQQTCSAVVMQLRQKESNELERLNRCMDLLDAPSATDELRQVLTEIIREKKQLIGLGDDNKKSSDDTPEGNTDQLFMQPV
ncbi:MAG: hypothetical protein JSU64_05865 [candidate division WOR-3 bacterium]|nr:MAG: hypothetical protein JSU64_05865 [candidate division WOR-3 bacterium]UCF05033.1 MAG: hypothetical protein JSV33_14105 [bacterium]